MQRIDRTLGMLLLLRDGRAVSAAELARRYEVSVRTVYRDMDALSAQGVPVYSEMGRTGGFRLREGYFLPPVSLGAEEAATLVLGLLFLRRLRVSPFPAEAEAAERKLMAVLPPQLRERLDKAEDFIGFERVPFDLLHREGDAQDGAPGAAEKERVHIGFFLRALLEKSRVALRYGPGSEEGAFEEVEPRALLWDRDRWYLAGQKKDDAEVRLFRADRVRELKRGPSLRPLESGFKVASLLERAWMKRAMKSWTARWPARVAMTPEQARLLKQDWYYSAARFEDAPDGRVHMVYGEAYPETALELVRLLGPGAQLLEPAEWRPRLAAQLEQLLAAHR